MVGDMLTRLVPVPTFICPNLALTLSHCPVPRELACSGWRCATLLAAMMCTTKCAVWSPCFHSDDTTRIEHLSVSLTSYAMLKYSIVTVNTYRFVPRFTLGHDAYYD